MRNRKPKQSKRLSQKSLDAFFNHSSSPGPASDIGIGTSVASTTKSKPRIRSSKKRNSPKKSLILEDNNGYSSDEAEAITFEPTTIEISSDEETHSPRRSRASKRKLGKERVSSDVNPDDAADDSQEETGIPVNWKTKPTDPKRRKHVLVESSDSEEISHPRPSKRSRFVKGKRPSTPEPDDLMDEVDEERVIENRLRTRDKKSAFQKNLEKLKRKKRGEVIHSSSEEEEEEESEDSAATRPFSHARPDNDDGDEPAEDGDGELDFIVEDDNETIELPDNFNMSAHQDLRHQIKIICQLFVHLAVYDGDDRREHMQQLLKDKYFLLPLQVTRRKIVGMRDSLVTSSVWRTNFKKPLEKYPTFEVTQLDFAIPACDACHLGGRMSTLVGRVSGSPYDKLTYEPLKKSPESDDSDEEDEEQETKEFNLGRFCARRTRVFHQFTHWEHALYHSLLLEVDSLRERYGEAPKAKGKKRVHVPVAFAGGVKPPDDLSDADAVMTWLDERKIIDREWHTIKEMMDKARNLEIAAKRGDDDDL
ncbi:hypothetical protein C8Q75DRAFT_740059 [Abortiporus biennis]|nr:hypothetical protein C8Q75DRAFT_740059 [Abortiporus biennis]